MISNLDANGLSHNPSPLQEDLARAYGMVFWTKCMDGRFCVLAWMVEAKSGKSITNYLRNDVLDGQEVEETQGNTNMWKDHGVLYCLQHKIYFIDATWPQK
jgi:hypothetical protein